VRLHVNIDHVATLRRARGTRYPEPVWAATMCELAGAHGITCHLREDRRHIGDRDLELLRQTVQTVLNLEMAATPELVAIAKRVKPDVVTLVPERREELTTEGGLDIARGGDALKATIADLGAAGIPVSLFIDPLTAQVKAAAAIGAPRIELNTGPYSELRGHEVGPELDRLAAAAEEGASLGLHVAAGHGLDYPNVEAVALIPGIEELNIGHAVICRAVFVGLDRAVRDMLARCNPGRG
jgi:pyridoxine 5-phosphate synthase